VGRSEADLLSSWGAPDNKVELSDGSKVYTWIRIQGNEYGVQEGRQTFTIDSDGRVKSWSYDNMRKIVRKW